MVYTPSSRSRSTHSTSSDMEFGRSTRRPSIITKALDTVSQYMPRSPARSYSRSSRFSYTSKRSTEDLYISAPMRTVISTPPRRLSADPFITELDLGTRAAKTLSSLYNTPSTPLDGPEESYISADVHIERNDQESHQTYADFQTYWNAKLADMPGYQLTVTETLVDEVQRKVLVRSNITGLPSGRSKESVDMLEFDEDGILVSLTGSVRYVKDDSEDEDFADDSASE